ncbi:MAG: type II toxin-antitoxin system VapC family toxin [Candidatus Dormibacteria bacterium]
MTVVLDASALLAVLNAEAGAQVVAPQLDAAVISAVNLSEVAGKLVDRGLRPSDVRASLEALQLDVRAFDTNQAFLTGELRTAVPKDFALGDRACLALASTLGAPALTADRQWSELRLPGVKVRVIR